MSTRRLLQYWRTGLKAVSGSDSFSLVVSDVVRLGVRKREWKDWLDLLTTVYYYSDDAAVTPALASAH